MQNGDEALPSIILACRGFLVPYILIKFCILIISLKLAKKRKRNMKKKVLVTPGFEPLCVRQLDYKKDSWITQPPHVVYYSPAALF